MLVETFPVGPLHCNCSIIACPETKEAAVIDPGGDTDDILAIAKEHGLTIKYLLHTHAHFDHILATRQMKEKTGATICLHKGDEWLYQNLFMQGETVGMDVGDVPPLPVEKFLEDDEELTLGNLKTKVIHTPGHTPGSLCFAHQDQKAVLFAGDTLFQQSIGRTDLWGGSFDEIIRSIKDKLFKLEESTEVVCGHGPNTTIWNEKKRNPFVGAR